MRTSFDIVLLLFTTCLVTGFKQFSTFFQNCHAIDQTLHEATHVDPKVVQWARTVFHLFMAQYSMMIVWLAISLYLEVNLSRRGQRDIQSKPVRLLQAYTAASIGMLLYLILSTVFVYRGWTAKLIRPLQAGTLTYSQETLDFLKKMDSLLEINYVFSVGIDIFIVFIIVQLWEEKTINEFRIRLENPHTLDISSLDGKSFQKYHFGSHHSQEKCPRTKGRNLVDELACLLA